MNFGIAFSFLSLNFGYTMNNLFSKFTKNRTGLLFIISLKKNKCIYLDSTNSLKHNKYI